MTNQDRLDETRIRSPSLPSADHTSDGNSEKIDPVQVPDQIGRYRIEKVLGHGGFGVVYLAHDDQLSRPVAIKVPHQKRVVRPEDAKAYLSEARTVANLDHSHIVPVHDAGSTAEFPCYIVSKYVEGIDLAKRLKQKRMTMSESAELVATVAEALHYAHKQGFVHRDVKPGNILLGADGKPYVVDFGLALKEENIGTGPRYAGTPAYMSPEQARGEGHRVDGRSDIFSLGVMFYELLVGRRPFKGDTNEELFRQVSMAEARPLRQIDDAIPKELERICMKAISKRANDRYMAAIDLAEDIRHFVSQQPVSTLVESEVVEAIPGESLESNRTESDTPLMDSEAAPIRIVPKGLRAFDAHDADFFLELVPGPRDRSGLPDILRFWKTRIEEYDPDETFSVGLIYGPSGCGKSSLVKAGLLPRLSHDVISVYVEATPVETEVRLLRGLRKRCPALPDTLDLKTTLASLRQGHGLPAGKKVLIVLDQFEQWLHTNQDDENRDLVQALRQCDGGRVQCIVMVRDDFWMSATRFMRDLEIRLLEADNSAAVDLFPVRHAKKVLTAFGRAFGTLPSEMNEFNESQKEFVKQSVAGLANDGKVICVRLSLFAERLKGKPWSLETLKSVGGTEGVGVTFLEETFSASNAPPQHRYHQKAARAVLGALLPDSGSEIKGQMKSEDELMSASGYRNRPREFNELIEILDGDLRLITPTDPDGVDCNSDSDSVSNQSQRYFQLTHDYLVHSLREWLTRKQRETRKGRAELRLSERSTTWNAHRESRQLPSTAEWIQIHAFTNRNQWNQTQSAMMRSADIFRGVSWLLVFLFVALAVVVAQQMRFNLAKENTVEAVEFMQASVGPAVDFGLERLEAFPPPLVLKELEKRFPMATGQEKLSLAYALTRRGVDKTDALIDGLLDDRTRSEEMKNVATALKQNPQPAVARIAALKQDSKPFSIQQQIRLAIVSLHLGELTLAQAMLTAAPDPEPRTRFINAFPDWGGDLIALADTLENIQDPDFRSGICLAIGSVKQPDYKTKFSWQAILEGWFETAPDSGTHGAARWALKQWEIPLPKLKYTNFPEDGSQWWSLSEKRSFVRILPGEIQGNQLGDRLVKVDSAFWLSDSETTTEQFQLFIDDESYQGLRPENWGGARGDMNATGEVHLPVQNVSWFDAVMYCNWLSETNDRKPFYTIEKIESQTATGESTPSYSVKEAPDGDGYRLPTESEWEIACRAGTTSKFSFGNDNTLLLDYGWYEGNSQWQTHTVRRKRCNPWGVFDTHGNVNEWCWESRGTERANRGGSWPNETRNCWSSNYAYGQPSMRGDFLGFRVAIQHTDAERSD